MSGRQGFSYDFQVEDVDDEHQAAMQGMMDAWKGAMLKMTQDQKTLKDQISLLERENEDLKSHNDMLESQLAAQGGEAPPAMEPAGLGIVQSYVGTTLKHERQIPIHTSPVHSVAMFKNSEMIATASWDQTCKLYNLASGEVVRTLGDGPEADSKMSGLYAVAFAKTNDDVLGCTSCDKSVYLWNHQSGTLLNKLVGHSNEVNGIDFHSSQQVMATASDDATCLIWDFQEGIMLRTLDQHSQAVYGCKFLGQENQYLVSTCCFDQNTRVFDMRDKSVVSCLQLHNDDVIGIDYASSKQLLATGSDDGKIGIYDTRQWRLVMTIDTRDVNQENEVKRVAFSPNGSWIAAGCSSGQVLVYDIEDSGKQVCQLGGHGDCVFDVTWGIDPLTNKKLLVSASHDHTCNFWKEA